MTLSDARRVISAAEKKAAEIGQPMNIAVADEGGNLGSHVRMDGAWIGSIDISQKKAYTSRAFDIATSDLATHSQSGGQFFGIHASNNGRPQQHTVLSPKPMRNDQPLGCCLLDSLIRGYVEWKPLTETGFRCFSVTARAPWFQLRYP